MMEAGHLDHHFNAADHPQASLPSGQVGALTKAVRDIYYTLACLS